METALAVLHLIVMFFFTFFVVGVHLNAVAELRKAADKQNLPQTIRYSVLALGSLAVMIVIAV